MRVYSRIALTLVAVLILCASTAPAQSPPQVPQPPQVASCPLALVASNPASSAFFLSPHGAFRFGNQFFVLRGQVLTTYTVTDLGDIQVAREDFIGTLGARESNGGVTFSNGILYVSSEAGLEIFDLRNVRAGGSPPVLLSRTAGFHYRRLAVSGGMLAGLFPATDLPCFVGGSQVGCSTNVDIFNVLNTAAPIRVGTLSSTTTSIGGFNDIAFNFGLLVVTGDNGTDVFNVANPALPAILAQDPTPGKFLVSNGTTLLAVGNDSAIVTFSVNTAGSITPLFMHTVATLRIGRSNPIMFHHQAAFDEQNSRLITMVDEMDPQTMQSARTFAFDTFDYSVPQFEGVDPRPYEQVSYTTGDEVKYNPLAVGGFVYVIGEVTGLQEYGVCGQMRGRIEWDNPQALPCGGAEIHGWVTGATKLANVELFLDNGSLGSANLSGPPRIDIASTTPVQAWRINVNLDATARGEHILRAIGTDINGNRRQFASQRVFFGGGTLNCFTRRRTVGP